MKVKLRILLHSMFGIKSLPPLTPGLKASKPNDNHGSDTTLHVKVEVDAHGKVTNVRRTYLKFDLSGLPSGAVIDSAILHMYRTKDNDIPSAYTTGDAWTETGITWNNQPGPGTFICDGALESGNWFKWDLTSYVASEFAGDKIVSVVLKFKVESGSDQHMDFTSSEGTWNQRPWLEISYHMPPPTATITFSQVGVGTDFSGVVLTVDGTDYYVSDLPIALRLDSWQRSHLRISLTAPQWTRANNTFGQARRDCQLIRAEQYMLNLEAEQSQPTIRLNIWYYSLKQVLA